MTVILYIVICLVFLTLFGLYQKSTNAVCKSKKRLDGKTALITGGTSGIGLETAMDFAHRGARVIIACPFQEEGNNARNSIIKITGNNNVIFKFLDLASLKSVRNFANDILNTEERLDLLINNAGVGIPADFDTEDGLNFIMQVNYFGHFLLTLLLLPLLKKTGRLAEPSRIINVSSLLHQLGRVDMDNLNRTGYYWLLVFIYSNSKLCMILFSRELTRKLKGSQVVVNCVDPGWVGTGIYNSTGAFGPILRSFYYYMSKTPWEGAQTTIHAALDDKAGEVSGGYFKTCRLAKARNSTAYDDSKAAKLWAESVKLVTLSDEELEKCLNKDL